MEEGSECECPGKILKQQHRSVIVLEAILITYLIKNRFLEECYDVHTVMN